MKKLILLTFCFAELLTFASGCKRSIASMDREDRNDPYVQAAISYEKEGNIEKAIMTYQKALDKNPFLAIAHLSLAQMLHDHKKDYVRAIYHYNRYLELRPETEKKGIIQGRIEHAKQMYAASFFKIESLPAEKVIALEKENAELKEEINRLKEEIAVLNEKVGKKKREISSITGKNGKNVKTYRVEKGDTLTTIAEDLYRDKNKWQLIYEANKDQIGESMLLKEGQILKIP